MTEPGVAVTPALTARETAVLAWADRARRTRVTVRDVAEAVGTAAAAKTAASLARKGVLDRVGRGVYMVRPLRAVAARWSVSTLASVAALLAGERYYVGGPAVLTLHRLTTQAYGSIVDVFVERQRRTRELSGARVVFHLTPGWALDDGLTDVTVEGSELRVSDPERTLIDLLDRPRLLGAVETITAVQAAAPRVDLSRLLEYALSWPSLSTCQRLGVLLERAGVPAIALNQLAARAGGAGVAAMIRGAHRRGRTHPVWRIVENDPGAASSSASARRSAVAGRRRG